MHEVSIRNGTVGYSGPSESARHIPTEVCETIIDMLYSYLARDTFQDIGTLHSCALLSDRPSIHRLSATLDAGQHLRGYVHEVTLIGYYLNTTASIFAVFPAVFAGKLPNVRRIDVIHLNERMTTGTETGWYLRTSHPPYWAKPLPHMPLHPRFPTFLSSFAAVSFLALAYTVFHSFSECARMLHALLNLEQLQCEYVRWLARGGSAHPGVDITKPPDWVAAGPNNTLPPFARRLRQLTLWDTTLYEAERLVWTRGPHLTILDITVPLSEDEDPARGAIDLSASTGLQTLFLSFTPRFSMDAHAGQVRALLDSWNPHRGLPLHPRCLVLRTYRDWQFTRRGFAAVLRGLGTIAEAWLQTRTVAVESTPLRGRGAAQYQLIVNIYDSEAARQWWSGHVDACFPTWLRLGRLRWNFEAPPNELFRWADAVEPLPPSDASS
ncbi:hypothetical protein V8D89_001332 [Ganoderma adspersum]